MQQRTVIACGVATAAAAFAVLGMMWTMLDRQQQLIQQQQTHFEKQQASFELLVTRLATPPKTNGSLKIEIDQPADVYLSGGSLKEPIQFARSKAAHELDFGEVQPGVYRLFVITNSWEMVQNLTIRTGEDKREKVRIPPVPANTKLELTTNLPEGHGEKIPVSITLADDPRLFEGHQWKFKYSRPRCKTDGRTFTLAPVPVGCLKAGFGYTQAGNKSYHEGFCDGNLENAVWPEGTESMWSAAPDCQTHFVEFETKADSNTCHIKFPAEWIASLNQKLTQTEESPRVP